VATATKTLTKEGIVELQLYWRLERGMGGCFNCCSKGNGERERYGDGEILRWSEGETEIAERRWR
jgi:hypothetical protein